MTAVRGFRTNSVPGHLRFGKGSGGRWQKETPMNWFYWALLSALFAGLTAILIKVGAEAIDPDLGLAIRVVVVVVFAWAIALARNTQSLTTIPWLTWLFLGLSGLATGASWLCYFRALQLGKASQVAPVDKLSVVVTMALAAVFLGEYLSWRHWIGGLLIVVGAVVLAWE
jgi:transporter family protein